MIARSRELIRKLVNPQAIRSWFLTGVVFVLLRVILRVSIEGIELTLITWVIVLAVGYSWLITKISLSDRGAAGMTVLFGAAVLFIRVGRLSKLLGNLVLLLLKLNAELVLRAYRGGPAPGTLELQVTLEELGNRLVTLISRIGSWMINLLSQDPVYDPVATAFVWGLVVFLIITWTVWMIFRHYNSLLGTLPVLTFAVLSLYYSGKSAYYLVPLLGAVIGLHVIVQHERLEASWREEQINYAGIIRQRVSPVAVMIAAGLMVFSALSPSLTIQSIQETLDRYRKQAKSDQELVRSLGIEPEERTRESTLLENQQLAGIPNLHLIGSGPDLKDQLVMIIQIEEFAAAPETFRPYWRGLTFDRYLGNGWASRPHKEESYSPGQQTLPGWPEHTRLVRQQVEKLEDLGGVVYGAGMPLSTDQKFQAAWRLNNTEKDWFDMFGASTKSTSYRVDSLQPWASSAELREAGQTYPDWVENRYLSLPDSVPERVLSLARDLTATEPTPYDRAEAIERYLRSFPYTLNLPTPPQDRDITEYFLFELKKGYCDYYATAMVVLSRAAGIPARLVTGYVGGAFDPDHNTYLVTADLAHSWVEVYFPEYGWIIFEPTGGRPAINRPAEPLPPDPLAGESPAIDPLVSQTKPFQLPRSVFLYLGPVLLAILAAAAVLADYVLLSRSRGTVLLPRVMKRITRLAHWIGLPSNRGDTAGEFTARLTGVIEEYAKDCRVQAWLQGGVGQLEEIARAYYQVLYSRARGRGLHSPAIARQFVRLRLRLLVLGLLVRARPVRIFRFLYAQEPSPASA